MAIDNTVFLKDPKILTKVTKLPDIHFPQSSSDVRFYYQFNLYVSEYKRYQWRPILEKGGGGRDCPGIWLHPATNDIMVRIATEGNVYTDIFYRNFPLRKWFTFAIYINPSLVNIGCGGCHIKVL